MLSITTTHSSQDEFAYFVVLEVEEKGRRNEKKRRKQKEREALSK